MGMKWYDYLAIILLTAGGLNWGLVGLFNFNLVAWLVGMPNWYLPMVLENIIYILMGASAGLVIWSAITGRFK